MRPSRRQVQPFVRRWPAGRPSATALVVALSIGAYGAQLLVEMLLKGQPTEEIFRQWLALDASAVHGGQWWKFVSFGLLHQNPMHLAADMLLLYFAGREVEPIVGSKHFLGIYLIGNLLGGAAHWFTAPTQSLVGVSAGVAAVVVAFTTILPELEVTMNLFFVIPVHVRAKHLAYVILATGVVCWRTQSATEIGPLGLVVGSIFGWAYVKQLGYGNPLAFQRYIFDRRQRASRLERMSAEQFMTSEMDPILEKIAQQGIKSLTRAERKILEQGREKMVAKVERK